MYMYCTCIVHVQYRTKVFGHLKNFKITQLNLEFLNNILTIIFTLYSRMEYSVYSIHAVYNSVYVEYVIKGDLKLLSGTVHTGG